VRKAVLPLLNVFAILALAGSAPATGLRAAPRAPQAEPFVVNWLLDEPDANTADGVCLSIPSAKCTLRAAVQQTNASPGPDSIVLGVGAYLLLRAGSDDTSLNGDLDILGDLTITGAGNAQTRILMDGSLQEGVLHVLAGAVLHLAGVQVEGGRIFSEGGGGGIFNQGHLSLVETVIYHNSAISYTNGGGIANSGVLTITRSLIMSNSAGFFGGGIYNDSGGRLTLLDSELRDNDAHFLGGGLFNRDYAHIEASTFYSNVAGSRGGGIYNSIDGNLFLINTTLSSNRSVEGGAALHNVSGNTNGYNLTIANNEGNPAGGDIYPPAAVYVESGSVNLRNSLLTLNYYKVGVYVYLRDCYGTVGVYGVVHFYFPGPGCTVSGPGQALTNVDTNLIGPLADNGGPTRTHALLPGNPAIDGTDAEDGYGCVDPNYDDLPTDQRGFGRVFGPRCDAGSYEYGIWVQLLPLIVR
jgi:hypothetical protein